MMLLKHLKRNLDRLFFALLRGFLPGKNPESADGVLILRTDGIGDLVFFLPYVQELKRHWPKRRIFLICRRESFDAVPRGLCDVVISFRHLAYRRNYFYRMFILWRIRSLKASVAIYASYHRQHIGDEMALLSGATTTYAFEGNDEGIHSGVRERNGLLYSTIVRTGDHIPESLKYQALLRKIGISKNYLPSGRERMSLLQNAEDHIPGIEGPYVVIAPGGSAGIRRWPAAHFALLADVLAVQAGIQPVLCGSDNEAMLLRDIAGRMRAESGLWVGRPLKNVAQLIRKAKMFVGNESGLLHFAASLNVPAVGIIGGGHFSRYFPYGKTNLVYHKLPCYDCNWNCPFPEPFCITNITLEEVVEEIRKLDVLEF